MKKGFCLFMLLVTMMFIEGCNANQSMDQYYREENISEKETVPEKKEITIDDRPIDLNDDIHFVGMGDTAYLNVGDEITQKEVNCISLSVDKIGLADSIDEIKNFSEKDYSDFFSKLPQYDMNFKLLEDGSYECPIKGIRSKILFIKSQFRNESNSVLEIYLNGLGLGNIDENKEEYKSIFYVKDFLFDRMQHTDASSVIYRFEPNETLDTILIYILPEQKIKSYLKDENELKVTETVAYDYKNMYLRCNALGSTQSREGEYYIHLDMGGE